MISASPLYRAYVLTALLVVYMFNFLDRTLIGVLGEPVRLEFGLSDWHMGLLSGPAFAFVYTFLGVPIALLAERHDRRLIIAIACALWSAMTLVCGIAATPWQFALGRIGVGIGEAGGTPPSHALISDYYPKSQRGTALAIYALGIPLGIMLASLLGVYVARIGAENWRMAFILMGVLGLGVSLIFALTIRDPRPAKPFFRASGVAAGLPPMQVIGTILGQRSFIHIALGGAIVSLIGYGGLQFTVPFWTRVHGLDLSEAALLHGLVFGLCAGIGTFAAGPLSDRLALADERAYGRMAALGFIVAAPCYVFGYNTLALTSGHWALWLAVPSFMLGTIAHYLYLAPMFTLTQNTVAPEMRATAAALLLFIVNMIGYVGGPPLIGFLSDTSAAWHLAQAGSVLELAECDTAAGVSLDCAGARAFGIRFAMSMGTFAYLLAAACFLRTGPEKNRAPKIMT